MVSILCKLASLLAARRFGRAAAARATIAGALIAVFSASASAVSIKLGGDFQESVEACTGSARPTCAVNFSQVPADKHLIVTNAVCLVRASRATTGFLHIKVGKWDGDSSPYPPWSFLKPTLTGIDSHTRYYVADGQILHLYDSGDTPRISVYPVDPNGTKIQRLTCTISGKLRNRPAP